MSKKRRTRSAAQRAATARLVALNKARRGRKPRKATYAANPIKRRRRSTAVVGRHVSRRRRNPIRLPSMTGIGGMLKPAFVGAAGAIAVDAAMAYVPLPAALSVGNMALVTRGAIAVLLGTVGRKLIGTSATTMAVGALTVTAYGLGKSLLAQSGFNLGYVGAGVATGMPAVGAAPAPSGVAGMGAYLPNAGVGFGPRSFAGSGLSEYIR